MRRYIVISCLLLLTGTAMAWAQEAKSPSAPVAAAKAPESAPFVDPNLKLPKDSGGKTTSALILGAPLKDDFVMGKPTAPLVMVEYASLSCPHCAHFNATVLPELEKQYIDTGKMRYILRQVPLNESALKGAELVDCVGEQNNDKYYVFSKVLFDSQNKWAFDSNFLSSLETIASVGGVSKDQFQGCLSTDREMKVLKQKKRAIDELHVPHTPYIFIGDEAYEGDRSIEAMSKFIDKKLAEIAKKPAQ